MARSKRPDLAWYKSLVYKTIIEPIPEEEGGGFEAHIPTLGRSTCVAIGDTEEKALQSLKEYKDVLLESWFEEGLPIPLPDNESTSTDEYSGKILVRTSKEMHRKLVQTAEKEGISLNALMNQALNRGYSLTLFEEHIAELISNRSSPSEPRLFPQWRAQSESVKFADEDGMLINGKKQKKTAAVVDLAQTQVEESIAA